MRLGELVGLLALGQDAAFGQPQESQARSTLLAIWLAESMGLGPDVVATTFWVAQLRYLGCTGHAHEVSTLFGDDLETRARTLLYDAAHPADVARDVLRHAYPQRRGIRRPGALVSVLATGKAFAEMHFRTGCEVGDVLAERLGMPDAVRESLACTFERWNGKGQPRGVSGEAIPVPMRIVHLTHDLEALDRARSPSEALALIRRRSGRAYDPALVGALDSGGDFLAHLGALDPWEEALGYEPMPRSVLRDASLDTALEVAADFADLKSPYTAGHSRAVAALAAAGCEQAGCPPDDVSAARRAGLVHDLGRTAVANSIWDKPGRLTAAETDRVRLHPVVTEQMLGRVPGLAALRPLAAGHHERADGTGYAKGLRAAQMSPAARILAAADRYAALTEPRAFRPARAPAEAAAELGRMAAEGEVDAAAADAVLAAAGHRAARTRAPLPAGLTPREAEVLRLIALGMTTRAVAEALVVSAKTADSHIQHIYTKIGCSTRGAAALFAAQHDLVG